MKLSLLLLMFVAIVPVAGGAWISVYAQTGSCTICTGPPEAPCCQGGQATGFKICAIAYGVCLTRDPCGGGGGCFVAGTLVDTLDGAVAVEDLRVGDGVVGRSDDGKVVVNEVVETHKSLDVEYFVINGAISVTGAHPFFVGGDWIEAKYIQVGDTLVSSDGTAVPVYSVESVDYGVRVYNISVSGNHTFFAGGILVHNKGPDPEG